MMVALATTLSMSAAQAFDDSKYPNWKGAWIGGWTERLPGVTGQPSYDPRSWKDDRQTREGRSGALISTVRGTPRRNFFDQPNRGASYYLPW